MIAGPLIEIYNGSCRIAFSYTYYLIVKYFQLSFFETPLAASDVIRIEQMSEGAANVSRTWSQIHARLYACTCALDEI